MFNDNERSVRRKASMVLEVNATAAKRERESNKFSNIEASTGR